MKGRVIRSFFRGNWPVKIKGYTISKTATHDDTMEVPSLQLLLLKVIPDTLLSRYNFSSLEVVYLVDGFIQNVWREQLRPSIPSNVLFFYMIRRNYSFLCKRWLFFSRSRCSHPFFQGYCDYCKDILQPSILSGFIQKHDGKENFGRQILIRSSFCF